MARKGMARKGMRLAIECDNLLRPKQTMTLFPDGRPGHFFPILKLFWSQMYSNGANAMCASALNKS